MTKQLTTMDYEKKYKNALEWARQVMTGETGFIRKEVEEVFPELKESEDEKIRKDVLAFIRCEGQHIDKYKWHKWIAWLEKQGEQKSIDDLTQQEAMDIAVAKCFEQGEQKPAWSEEDERNLEGIIDEIKANKNNAPDYDLAIYDRFLDWLKSLKERMKGE